MHEDLFAKLITVCISMYIISYTYVFCYVCIAQHFELQASGMSIIIIVVVVKIKVIELQKRIKKL